jgi:hypothetical protein
LSRDGERCWGTADEIDFVRAAGGDLAAWERCRHSVDDMCHLPTRLGSAVFSHLPPEDPDRELLKGIYRRAFYTRRLLLGKAAEALDVLNAEGIETMLLKGAALGDLTTRAMADVDLLVRPRHHEAATQALVRAGWSAEPEVGPLRHDGLLRSPNGCDLDLHAFALMESLDDDDLWDAAEPFELLGRATLVPCATDQLLIVCVHGLRYNADFGPSWAADAITLLRARAIDWDRLVADARRRRLTAPVTAALCYLADEYDAAVPASALSDLRATPTKRSDRLAHRAAMRQPTYLGLVTLMWDRWRRVTAITPADATPPGFTRFLADSWGFERRRDLVRHAVVKLTERNYR